LADHIVDATFLFLFPPPFYEMRFPLKYSCVSPGERHPDTAPVACYIVVYFPNFTAFF
jgi:hypothetical protein